MAQQNYMTNGNYSGQVGLITDQIHNTGVREAAMQSTINVLSTDTVGSTYLLAKNFNGDAVIDELKAETDAITGGTLQVGLYDSDTGAAVTPAAFAAALSIATASSKLVPLDAMPALTHDQTLQPLYLLAGKTLLNKKACYDLVATLTAAPSASGFVTFRGRVIPAG